MQKKATVESVLSAARHIHMNGSGRCTADSILAITGGSKSTVLQLIRENAEEIEKIASEKITLPLSIQDEMRGFALSLWGSAVKAVRAQEEDFDRSCRNMVRRAEQEAVRAVDANAELGELLRTREATIAELRQSLRETEEQLAAVQISERSHRERADRAEARNDARTDLLQAMREQLSEFQIGGLSQQDDASVVAMNAGGDEQEWEGGAAPAALGSFDSLQLDLEDTLRNLSPVEELSFEEPAVSAFAEEASISAEDVEDPTAPSPDHHDTSATEATEEADAGVSSPTPADGALENQGLAVSSPSTAATAPDVPERRKPKIPAFLQKQMTGYKQDEPAWDDPFEDRR
ncbi:hypothetical protein [Aurantimonas sp. HBX-1]|uniref:hypothetical protein n=1 Tax=Aurantimonas sp. HBX-1 TaxID=2906072 RepID=UPI001F1DC849|nr:hypothetical protein [Aurantimonas sp. HBX-1]UIJ73468.1 hypothetical protein LXB15_07500 [Aurantimonas sp. HBX-1]